ncbi:MAG TPA: hypothetical protein DCK76_03345 [Desulfotomaculum sp.]|nr:hypothetical protein [Desulfotomaculum sp.]HBY04015.1 hypothetical protein [Desulfotomaculum sp.]
MSLVFLIGLFRSTVPVFLFLDYFDSIIFNKKEGFKMDFDKEKMLKIANKLKDKDSYLFELRHGLMSNKIWWKQ